MLLIFYLKLNCRYRVINKIHPCLSHTNSFLSKVFSWFCLGKVGGSVEGGAHSEGSAGTVAGSLRPVRISSELGHAGCVRLLWDWRQDPSPDRAHASTPPTKINHAQTTHFLSVLPAQPLPLPFPRPVCAQGKQSSPPATLPADIGG